MIKLLMMVLAVMITLVIVAAVGDEHLFKVRETKQ